MTVLLAPPLQAGIEQQLQQVIGDVLAFVPTVIAAIIVLVVGFIVGRILGGIVARILRRIGLDQYTRGTALDEISDGDGGLERALGKVVAYYVYFVTLLAAANVLGIAVLSRLLSDLGAYLPVILGAIVILVIGFIVGRVIGNLVAGFISGFGLGRFLQETPLERFADEEGEFGRIVGKIVAYYVYFVTLLAAADVLEIAVLSRLLSVFAGYIPALIAGVIVLIVGILVAEFVEDLIAESDRRQVTDYTGLAVKVFIYYITVTLALDTIGFDTTVLTTLFTAVVVAFLGALAVALAIGMGIGIGFGSREYISENIDRWAAQARESLSENQSRSGTGGSDTELDN